MQLALDALNRGNGRRALEHLAEVTDVEDPGVWHLRALALLLLDDAEAAEDASRRGLSIAPNDAQLHLVRADSLESLGRPAEAEAALLAILNQQPEHPQALRQYAWLLARTGDAQGARSVMARFSDASLATDAGLIALQGYIAMIEGKRKQASEFLQVGMAMAPEAASMRMLRALELQLNSRSGEAVSQMRAAAAMDPDLAGAAGREARYLGHPFMAPIRFVDRLGTGKLWIGWLVVLFGLPRVWPAAPMGWIIVIYLLFAVYTWTMPFLLRKWMTWRGQL